MSIFKDFKFNIVVNVIYRRKINSLAPLLLIFTNLLTNVCHTIYYVTGSRGLVVFRKGG